MGERFYMSENRDVEGALFLAEQQIRTAITRRIGDLVSSAGDEARNGRALEKYRICADLIGQARKALVAADDADRPVERVPA